MPVTLPVDHPTQVMLSAVFGSHYGVIRCTLAGQSVVAPVSFALPAACGDYQVLCERTVRELLVPGMTLVVQAQASTPDPRSGLIVVDILLAGGTRTVADLAISRGWMVPSWPCSVPARQALAWARSHHAGIWSEADVSATSLGLGAALDQATAPPPAAAHAALVCGCLAVLLAALAAQTAVRPLAAGRRAGGWPRLPLTVARWYAGGLLRPRVRPPRQARR